MSRALIVAPAWIGDAVLSHPLVRKLFADGMSIDVLAPKWVAPVYERMAEISRVIDSPFRHGEVRIADRLRLGRLLASQRYDSAYVLPNSLKSAIPVWSARIPCTVGYRGELRSWLLTDCRALDKAALPTMAERFVALASRTPDRQAVELPSLTVNREAQAAAMQKFGLQLGSPVVALCPGAEYGIAKRWPTRHFAELAGSMLEKGRQIWLFGGPSDRATADEINAALGGRGVVLAGKTALSEAIDLLAVASQVVTNDSGLMHIACAVGVPVAAIYGSSSPSFTPPLSPRARIISLNVECSPCFERECPLGHFKCMNELSATRVLDSIQNSP